MTVREWCDNTQFAHKAGPRCANTRAHGTRRIGLQMQVEPYPSAVRAQAIDRQVMADPATRKAMALGFPPPVCYRGFTPDEVAPVRRTGLLLGYPVCCVEEFCDDLMGGRFPAELRGTVKTPTGSYVPCCRCARVAS
jgi:hypothetical protein